MQKTKSIKQTAQIPASPKEVYEALMDSKIHSEFTGSPAKISKKEGGKFTAFGDYVSGKNIKLVEGKKIVQEWVASEFPKGHTSTVTYILTAVGKGRTKITFTHENVPAEKCDSLKQGWIDYYWEPLKEYFSKK